MTGLTGMLEDFSAEGKVPAEDDKEEWSVLEDSITGVGTGLEEPFSISVVIGLAAVLEILTVGERVPVSDGEEE